MIGYIHNDLKLDNILIGNDDPSTIYLIDFGTSTKYLDTDGAHIQNKRLGSFTGNLLFSSINSCKGNTKSRRDDVESAIFIMIYLLNG